MPGDWPDLRAVGDQYRLWNEIERRWAHARDDPDELVIPGRAGFVAVYGAGTLVACTNGIAATKRILVGVPGARVTQDGDDGQNIAFPAEHLPIVAELLRLRKRRRCHLTPEQLRAGAERLASYQFRPQSPANSGVNDGS
jgi:hypothetical protein